MTLRHFKIFVAVCDNMNMTAAAKSLFISQSAVSQAVYELEDYYGVRLFERLSKRLYLTQAGERLLDYARHMIHINDDIEKNMRTLSDDGFMRLGASVTVGTDVLPSLVSGFKKTVKNTTIEVFEDNTEQIEKRIICDETDIGLVEGEISSPDLVKIPFMDDELILVCGTNHRFANVSLVEPKELEKEDIIIREQGSGTRKIFESAMSANEIAWKAAWTCNNTSAIIAAVSSGLGVTVISRRSVENEIKNGVLAAKKIKGIAFKRTFKLVYHKNKFLTEKMKLFIDYCMNVPKQSSAFE